MSQRLLHARPYWISSSAPAGNSPDTWVGYLDVYLVTGLFGDLVVEECAGVEPPTNCAACSNEDTVAVEVRGGCDVDGREEWYCPQCGAIESDMPLQTRTRIRDQPFHWLLTALACVAWISVISAVGVLVGFFEVANRVEKWFRERDRREQ